MKTIEKIKEETKKGILKEIIKSDIKELSKVEDLLKDKVKELDVEIVELEMKLQKNKEEKDNSLKEIEENNKILNTISIINSCIRL